MREIYKDIERINSIDPASGSERLCKLFEESGELAQAVNKKIGRKVVTESDDEVRDLILEEVADTIQCVMSLILTWDITYDELLSKIESKNIKWETVALNRNKK
jgi:NTP pyrophosphatase (non-canonical NTP hydrolase)